MSLVLTLAFAKPLKVILIKRFKTEPKILNVQYGSNVSTPHAIFFKTSEFLEVQHNQESTLKTWLDNQL